MVQNAADLEISKGRYTLRMMLWQAVGVTLLRLNEEREVFFNVENMRKDEVLASPSNLDVE